MNSNLLNSALKIDLVSYPARADGLGKYDKKLKSGSIAKENNSLKECKMKDQKSR